MDANRVIRTYLTSLPRLFSGPVLLLTFCCLTMGALLWTLLIWSLGPIFADWLSQLTSLSIEKFWGTLLVVILSFPLFVIAALVSLSILAVPWLRRSLRKRGHQARADQGGLSLSRQVSEGLSVAVIGILLWILSLSLFWIPPVAIGLSLLSVAWAQYRLMALEIWGETESSQSFARLRKKHQTEGLFLSLGLATLTWVPLLNLALPVISALVFLQWDQELQKSSDSSASD